MINQKLIDRMFNQIKDNQEMSNNSIIMNKPTFEIVPLTYESKKKCTCGCHTSPPSDENTVKNGCDLYYQDEIHNPETPSSVESDKLKASDFEKSLEKTYYEQVMLEGSNGWKEDIEQSVHKHYKKKIKEIIKELEELIK